MRILIWPLLLLCAAEIRGADFCALTVKILNPDDSPSRLTRARFFDPSGALIFDKLVDGPVLQICDFGFGEHKLTIGPDNCYPVSFSGLRLRMDDPIHLVARLNACSRAHFLGNLCSVYLRIRSPDGAPIEGAKLTLIGNSEEGLSDSMGRLAALLVPGQSSEAKVSKEGYTLATFGISCKPSERIEKSVTLARNQ